MMVKIDKYLINNFQEILLFSILCAYEMDNNDDHTHRIPDVLLLLNNRTYGDNCKRTNIDDIVTERIASNSSDVTPDLPF